MTVGAQVKQTLASLRGARATLETFAEIEENREAGETLADCSLRIEPVIRNFEKRLAALEFEEPQYRGF